MSSVQSETTLKYAGRGENVVWAGVCGQWLISALMQAQGLAQTIYS